MFKLTTIIKILLKDKKDQKKKWEPPIPTRVGKKKKRGPDSTTKLPQGIITLNNKIRKLI